jgi:hypothetical protein
MYLTKAQQLEVIRALNLDKLPEMERVRILKEVDQSERERGIEVSRMNEASQKENEALIAEWDRERYAMDAEREEAEAE